MDTNNSAQYVCKDIRESFKLDFEESAQFF